MDLQKLAATLLSSDAINGLSKRSGASNSEVKKVLSQALPALLGGADEQAKGADTVAGFAAALSSHAKSNTIDLSDFLGNVDLEDGTKILGHLLGGGTEKTTKTVAKKAGVSNDKTATIMAAAAPLLMSLLGQQADDDDDKDSGVGALIGTLLSNVDVGELLTDLLTDDSGTKKKTSTQKTTKKKSTSKKAADKSVAGEILGSLLKSFLK